MAQITKDQIIFDHSDWTAGLAKNNAVIGINNPSNRAITTFDPFREYGVAQPGKLGVNPTNNSGLGGAMVAMVLKDTTTAYGVDTAGKIHEYNYSTNVLTTGSFPYTIVGASPVGQDAIVYRHKDNSTVVSSFFYSYYNDANWNIGCYRGYTTLEHDFMSVRPDTPLDITSGDGVDTIQLQKPHIMEIGSDDILYILSGRYLHAYDGGGSGAYGTFSSKVLTLPQGFIGTGLLKYQDKLLIAGVYTGVTGVINSDYVGSAGEALVYVWNYIDLDVNQVIPLDDPYVSSIFSWRGQICVITSGESEGFGTLSATKLKIISGNTATKLAEFTGTVSYRGVDSGSRVLYLNVGGKIYAIGDNLKEGYNVNHIMSCVSTSQAGFIKNLVNNVVIAGSSDGSSTHSLSKFSPSTVNTAVLTTCYYPIHLPEGKVGSIKSVTVEYYATVTNADMYLTITLATDINASFQNDQNVVSNLATITAPAQKIYKVDASGNPFGQFSTVRLGLVWNQNIANSTAVKVTKVIINYELIALNP